MDNKELMLIQELMDKLSEEMEYGEDELSERLGRKKPEVEVLKVESKIPLDEESIEMSELEEDCEMEDESEDMFGEEKSPEDDLKKRLMKLRG